MFRLAALHKLDARKVLPVSHRLLEQRLVRTAKVRIDLVRNHTVVPDALRFGGGRPRRPMVRQRGQKRWQR